MNKGFLFCRNKGDYIMNATNLSERLQRVANYVQQNAIVADIGSDHAYLPCNLVLSKKVTKAFACEVVQGPYQSAVDQVNELNLQQNITVRLEDGLLALSPEDQVTTITIAGMGGPLIATILEKGIHRVPTVQRFILQPNIHAKAIREWAIKNGWKIIEEEIFEEDDKTYEIIVLERGEMQLSPLELWLGPLLLQQKNSAFQNKWSRERAALQQILLSMKNADETEELLQKKSEVHQKLAFLKEVLPQ